MNYRGFLSNKLNEIPNEYKDIVEIGKNTFIKEGTVIGGDGFHFRRNDKQELVFTEHKHKLIIGNNVWIGAGCNIDRGRFRDTVINDGTKLDSMVHISHNVIIGKNCIIGQGSTILGGCEIGDESEIWSHVVVQQHVKIGKRAVIGANSYIRKDIPDDHVAFMFGDKLIVKPKSESKKYK